MRRTGAIWLIAAALLSAWSCGDGSRASDTATTQATAVASVTGAAATSTATTQPPATATSAPAATNTAAAAVPANTQAPPTRPPVAATSTPAPPPPPPPAPTARPGGGTIAIFAKNILFDPVTVSVAAGPVTVSFSNQDTGVAHNIHFFRGADASGASLGMTPIAPGPDQQSLSLGNLAPGTYFYQCDVHHGAMKGTLTVS